MWEFDFAWDMAADEGACNATGSVSYWRCRKEWADYLATLKREGTYQHGYIFAEASIFVRARADSQTGWEPIHYRSY